MKGSKIFKKFSFLLKLLTVVMAVVPEFIKQFLWNCSSPFSGIVALAIRYSILKSSCLACGDNVYVGANVIIKGIRQLEVGNNVSIHTGCYLDASGGINIGSEVSIAHHCTIMSFNHTWDDPFVAIKYNPVIYKSVKIANDVWIGCAARIMPGVMINNRSVIAAGAVVVSDVESNTLVGGVPARKIKRLIES